jgi:hypothetical protein
MLLSGKKFCRSGLRPEIALFASSPDLFLHRVVLGVTSALQLLWRRRGQRRRLPLCSQHVTARFNLVFDGLWQC